MMSASPATLEGVFDFEDDVLKSSSDFASDVTKGIVERVSAALPKGSDVDQVTHVCQECIALGAGLVLRDIAGALCDVFKGWDVIIRSSLGSSNKQQCLTSLRHSYIVMQHPSGKRLLIDPSFRDSFTLGHSNERYDAVLDALPSVFVGTASDLAEVVKIVSAEISDLYFKKGLSVPPWRQSKALMSRWLSQRKEDSPVSETVSVSIPVKSVVQKLQARDRTPAPPPAVYQPAKIVYGFPAASVQNLNNEDFWVLKTSLGFDSHAIGGAHINDVMCSAFAHPDTLGNVDFSEGLRSSAVTFEAVDAAVLEMQGRGNFDRTALNDGWTNKNDLKVLDGALKDRMWNFRKVKLTGPVMKGEKDGIVV